jgi:hypothetical protein
MIFPAQVVWPLWPVPCSFPFPLSGGRFHEGCSSVAQHVVSQNSELQVCCLHCRFRSRAWTRTCGMGMAPLRCTLLLAADTWTPYAGCCVTGLAWSWTSSGRAPSTTPLRTSRWRCVWRWSWQTSSTRCAPWTSHTVLFQCLNILVQHGATPDYHESRHKSAGCSCCKGESQEKVSCASRRSIPNWATAREIRQGLRAAEPIVEIVKVKFALKQAMKTQRGSRGITLLFL